MPKRKTPQTPKLPIEEILQRAQTHLQAAHTLEAAASGPPLRNMRTIRQVTGQYRRARQLYMRLLRHPYYAERLTQAQRAECYAAVKIIDEVLIGLS